MVRLGNTGFVPVSSRWRWWRSGDNVSAKIPHACDTRNQRMRLPDDYKTVHTEATVNLSPQTARYLPSSQGPTCSDDSAKVDRPVIMFSKSRIKSKPSSNRRAARCEPEDETCAAWGDA